MTPNAVQLQPILTGSPYGPKIAHVIPPSLNGRRPDHHDHGERPHDEPR